MSVILLIVTNDFFLLIFSMLVSGCVQFTLFGAGTVYLLLSSQIIQDLFENIIPNFGFCTWFLIIAALLCPAMWLGTPKDFRYVKSATSCLLVSVYLKWWLTFWKDMWSRWNKHGKDTYLNCLQSCFYGPWKFSNLININSDFRKS